jgi:hypothetical protein
MYLPEDPLDWPRYAGLTIQRYHVIRRVAGRALQAYHEDNEWGVWEEVSAITDNDEKLVLWRILKNHSSLRSLITRMSDEQANRSPEGNRDNMEARS